LRICVNQNLQRNTYKFLDDDQEKFWKINNLDVFVSSKEQGFVESIQTEILNNSFLIAEIFTEQEITRIIKEKSNFDDDTIISLIDDVLKDKKMIVRKAIVDGQRVYEKSPDFSAILKQQNLPIEQAKIIESIFATDTSMYVQKGENKKNKKKVFIKASKLREFTDLWNTINKNADYYLETLNTKQETQLINNIKTKIEGLDITAILLETKRREIQVDKLDKTDAIKTRLIDHITYKSKVDYLGFVKSLSNATKTPITFIVKVFNALSKDFKEKMLCNNPEQAQKEMVEIIQKNLVNMIKTNVTYKGLTGIGLPNVFKVENGKTYLETGSVGKFQKDIDKDFDLKEKWVFEEVIEYDSDFELEVIEQDPDTDSIEIFGKLPKLKIKTPLGEYNPDFCYVIKSIKGNKLFLIVETKGYKTDTEIPENEKGKIDFAKKYFESLNQLYKNEKIKITYRKRINRQQLSAIISEVTE